MSRDGPAKGPARARDQAGASRGPPVAGRLRHGSAPRSSLPPARHRGDRGHPPSQPGLGADSDQWWGGDGVEMGGPMMGATLGKGENPPRSGYSTSQCSGWRLQQGQDAGPLSSALPLLPEEAPPTPCSPSGGNGASGLPGEPHPRPQPLQCRQGQPAPGFRTRVRG